MKKLLLCSLIGLASPSYADFIGIYGQIGQWNAGFTGTVAGTADKIKREANEQAIPSFEQRGLDNDNQLTGWVAFEHPIPLLPNIRLGFTGAQSSGWSTESISTDKITVPYNGVDITYDGRQPIYTTMQFDAFDGVFYWELLDNWFNLDVGLTVRSMQGDFKETIGETALPIQQFGGADGCGGLKPTTVVLGGFISLPGCIRPETTAVTPIDLTLPLIYLKGQIDIPLTGVYISTTFQGMQYDGNGMLDIDVAAGYNFSFTVVDIGASLGYREARLEAKDLSGLYAKDAKLSGVYGALNIHF